MSNNAENTGFHREIEAGFCYFLTFFEVLWWGGKKKGMFTLGGRPKK